MATKETERLIRNWHRDHSADSDDISSLRTMANVVMRADGDRDHMCPSNLTVEQTVACASALRLCADKLECRKWEAITDALNDMLSVCDKGSHDSYEIYRACERARDAIAASRNEPR